VAHLGDEPADLAPGFGQPLGAEHDERDHQDDQDLGRAQRRRHGPYFTALRAPTDLVDCDAEVPDVVAQAPHRQPELSQTREAHPQALGPSDRVARGEDEGDGPADADGGWQQPEE
jgi:hypothetical protein